MSRLLLPIILSAEIRKVVCQINLGTFSLNRNPAGDLQIGLNQMANIFGFGGDRGLQLTTGSGKFNVKSNQGALIGGERVGVNSRVDVREGQGLDLDSVLNFGNQPSTPGQPAGQLGAFIENISKFFQSFGKQSISPMPTSLSPLSTVESPISMERMGTSLGVIPPESERISLEESETPEGSDTSLQQSKLTARRSWRYDAIGRNISKSDAERGELNNSSMIMLAPTLRGLVELDGNE